MLKKNVSIILIILLALLLIALVIRLFDKRLENVDRQMHPVAIIRQARNGIIF